jgi:hypothetical protein
MAFATGCGKAPSEPGTAGTPLASTADAAEMAKEKAAAAAGLEAVEKLAAEDPPNPSKILAKIDETLAVCKDAGLKKTFEPEMRSYYSNAKNKLDEFVRSQAGSAIEKSAKLALADKITTPDGLDAALAALATSVKRIEAADFKSSAGGASALEELRAEQTRVDKLKKAYAAFIALSTALETGKNSSEIEALSNEYLVKFSDSPWKDEAALVKAKALERIRDTETNLPFEKLEWKPLLASGVFYTTWLVGSGGRWEDNFDYIYARAVAGESASAFASIQTAIDSLVEFEFQLNGGALFALTRADRDCAGGWAFDAVPVPSPNAGSDWAHCRVITLGGTLYCKVFTGDNAGTGTLELRENAPAKKNQAGFFGLRIDGPGEARIRNIRIKILK